MLFCQKHLTSGVLNLSGFGNQWEGLGLGGGRCLCMQFNFYEQQALAHVDARHLWKWSGTARVLNRLRPRSLHCLQYL